MSQFSSKKLEMGYTPSEFRKTLGGQFIDNKSFILQEVRKDEWIIKIKNHAKNASVRIIISESAPRKIATLSLPVLNTFIEFQNFTTHQENEFMILFFRYFHKGGG